MTIGMVVVACFAACVPGVPWVTMTSTFSRTSSAASPVQPLIFSFRPAELDGDVPAFHVAEVTQTLPQLLDVPL